MCGIAGFLHFDTKRKASTDSIRDMTNVISHRGPDGEGCYVHENLALGHRRLSIIDLSTGHQPMYSEDNKIVLVFNGEIYNYVEVREELMSIGNKFFTTSDTEVIINAYRTWGIDCLSHFNGMWAFALWDEELEQLFISRDRIGEKPLYFSTTDNSFIFGSEIKSVIAYGVSQAPRQDLTELYLTLNFIPAPFTFYKEISQVLPGQYILIKGGNVRAETYWDLPDVSEKDLIKDKQLVENEFAKLFDDAVRIRMRSDVEFGAFLSGGLDSSCVVGTMTKHTAKPVETFTIGFENKAFDESGLAKLVANKFSTNHHKGMVSSEHFDEALAKILHHYDDPFGDPSAIPTGHISRYAAGYVKMVLTGDGGDEVLSGYTIYQGEKFAKQYQGLPAPVRKMVPWMVKIVAKPFRGKLRYKLNRVAKVLSSSNLSFEERLLSKLAYTSPENLKAILKPSEDMISFHDFYTDIMKGCRFTDPFYKLMYFQHKVTLPGDMLTKVDRMSMAYSIETRIPFLDYRIIEFMFRVHKDIKTKGYINKIVLRNAVANRLLPEELLKAPKKGFSVPLRDWFKEDELNNKIKDILLDKNDDHTAFNTDKLGQLIAENKEGTSDAGNFIWAILVFRMWMNKHKIIHQ